MGYGVHQQAVPRVMGLRLMTVPPGGGGFTQAYRKDTGDTLKELEENGSVQRTLQGWHR
jgi:hypothetical protein